MTEEKKNFKSTRRRKRAPGLLTKKNCAILWKGVVLQLFYKKKWSFTSSVRKRAQFFFCKEFQLFFQFFFSIRTSNAFQKKIRNFYIKRALGILTENQQLFYKKILNSSVRKITSFLGEKIQCFGKITQ